MALPSLSLNLPNVPPRALSRTHRWGNRLLMSLILVGLGLIVYPFWPEAHYQLRHALPSSASGDATGTEPFAPASTQAAEPRAGRRLIIPDIGVDTPIVEGTDVGILDRAEGVWHQVGEVGAGNLVLAGHRFKYLPPNTTTFYHLDKLQPGDTMILWWDGQRRAYVIERSFSVDRSAVEILNPTSREQLTLYTCTDLAASQRLVVVAKPSS